jgi:hypothetical protein
MAEFNISLAHAYAASAVVMVADPVYSQGRERLKNQRKPTCG